MTKNENYIYFGALALIFASLLPWFNTYIAQAINVDIAFLSLSAERLLAGETMSEAFYDTNPPLSIIIQIPAILLAKTFSMPLYYAVSTYIFLLLTLSITATHFLLKKIPDLSLEQRTLIICTLLFTNTILAGYDFGQKDHILGMALFPLILAQILITMRIDMNIALKWSVLIAGALLILLKPHYGLIPAAIFLHRAYTQKRIAIFMDHDFLCLGGMAIAYIASIYLFFPDFINIILLDIITFYASDISKDIISMGMMVALLPIICAGFSLFIFKDLPKLIPVIFLISALCIIPFILQGKGWIYHLLPALTLFTIAFAILFNRLLHIILAELKVKNNAQEITLSTTFILIISMILYAGLAGSNKPTHDEYKSLEFTKIINECEGDCSFLVLHDMINMAHELSIYTGQPHASRFPVMWFVPTLLNAQIMLGENKKEQFLTQEQIDQATIKYTDMMAQDFIKYKPDIIFIAHLPHPSKKDMLFNYHDYLLEKNDRFKNIWNNYNFERTISIDRIEYMGQKKPNETLMPYDIYRRIKPDN